MSWLVLVLVGYTAFVDAGSSGLAGSTHMITLFVIYAVGDGLTDWLWPRLQGKDDSGDGATQR